MKNPILSLTASKFSKLLKRLKTNSVLSLSSTLNGKNQSFSSKSSPTTVYDSSKSKIFLSSPVI